MKRLLERLARWSGWLLIVLMAVTCVDVVCRKLVIPIPFTIFQELQWHIHTAIFSMWMGFNYTINAHPRVDSYTERLSFRARAWIELIGCMVLALPYAALLAYYGVDYALTAYVLNETSESPLGIPHRWVIKSVMLAGFVLVLLGIVSVVLRLVVFLADRSATSDPALPLGSSKSEV